MTRQILCIPLQLDRRLCSSHASFLLLQALHSAASHAHRPPTQSSPRELWALWCTQSSMDQNTKSGLRLVEAISGGKMCRWLMSASILQSRDLHRCPFSDLVEWCLGVFCSSWTKVALRGWLLALWGKEWFAHRLFSRADARLFSTWLCLGTPWDLEERIGGNVRGEGSLGVPAQAPAPLTRPRMSVWKWMDGYLTPSLYSFHTVCLHYVCVLLVLRCRSTLLNSTKKCGTLL